MGFFIFILLLLGLFTFFQSSENSRKIAEIKEKIENFELELNNLSYRLLGVTKQANQSSEKIAHYEQEIKNNSVTPDAENIEIQEETKPIKKVHTEICESIVKDDKQIDEIKQVLSEFSHNEQETNGYDTPYRFQGQNASEDSSVEKIFMGNLFSKIGAIILIISAVIFVKLTGIEFTPLAKTIIAYLTSIALIAYSGYLHNSTEKKEMKNFAEILWGTGLSISFITTYVATGYFDIMPLWLCGTICALLIILTFFISEKYKSLSGILIGMFGGYLMPFSIHHELSSNFIFGYLIFLNTVGIIYSLKNNTRTFVSISNLIFSTFIIAFYAQQETVSIAMPISLWLMYFLGDLICNLSNKNSHLSDIINWANLAILTILVNIIYDFKDPIPAGLTLLFCGVIYLTLHLHFRNKNNFIYLYNAISAMIGATFFLSSEVTRICAFSIEAALLSLAAFYFKFKELQKFPIILSGFIFCAILYESNILFNDSLNPVFNIRAIMLLVPAVCFLLCSIFTKEENKGHSSLFAFFSLTAFFIYLIFEINTVNIKTYGFLLILKSMLGFIYSISISRLYKAYENEFFKCTSLLLYSISYISLVVGTILSNNHHSINNIIPIINLKTIGFLTSLGTIHYMCKLYDLKNLGHFYLFTISLLLFSETGHLTGAIQLGKIAGIIKSITLSVFAFALMIFGISKENKTSSTFGIGLLLIMFIKIIFVDLFAAGLVWQLFAFIIVGIIMMYVSYFYTKKNS